MKTETLKTETTKTKAPKPQALSPELLRKMNAYWRAANYLSCAQIYLYDNVLLREPLKLAHVKPLVVGPWGTTPGSIHEGGELGYSLSHAFGAAFDNPELIVACVIGDGEAETGPLATLAPSAVTKEWNYELINTRIAGDGRVCPGRTHPGYSGPRTRPPDFSGDCPGRRRSKRHQTG